LSVEYAELGTNMRQCRELRLTRLSVFLAATGALVVGYFVGPRASLLWLGVPVLGLVLTACYWALLGRLDRDYRSFLRRAVDLEEGLGFAQYGGLPSSRWSDFLIGLVFLACLVVWLLLFVDGFIQWNRYIH
jgi:hypothetical protein